MLLVLLIDKNTFMAAYGWTIILIVYLIIITFVFEIITNYFDICRVI